MLLAWSREPGLTAAPDSPKYFNSLHWLRIDWATAEQQFNRAFYVTDEGGVRRPPTIVTAWKWFKDFVLADFQPRASFVAGFMLGVRFG